MSKRATKRAKAKRDMRRSEYDSAKGSRDHLVRAGSQNPHKQGPTGPRKGQRSGGSIPRY